MSRSGMAQALHPHRAEVAAVLDGILVEDADLSEAKLAVQRDRRVVGQDDARERNVHRFAGEAAEQRTIKSGAYALATAADVECDADLDGLPETCMIAVGLAGRVAEDLITAPGNEQAVRAGAGEPAEPAPPFREGDGLAGEGGVGARDRVIEDVHDRGKIVLGPGLDLDGVIIGWCMCPRTARSVRHRARATGARRERWPGHRWQSRPSLPRTWCKQGRC